MDIKPDDAIHYVEFLAVQGQLSKMEKARYTQMFLNPSHLDDNSINIICDKSGVGDVCINSPDIRNVFRMEFPPSELDFFSENWSYRTGTPTISSQLLLHFLFLH